MEQRVNQSTRNFKMLENPDIFIAGLTSSGKTTVANYIIDYFDYRPLRNAGTIKQILCERYNCSFKQLEEMKRTDPKVRDAHHEVSAYLTKEGTINRCGLIANRESFEFEFCKDPEKEILVHDVRDIEEASVYLKNDFIGIFLSRTTSDYVIGGHWTDNNMFMNGDIIKLSNTDDFAERMILVLNGGQVPADFMDNVNSNVTVITFDDAQVTKEQLLEKLDAILTPIIEKTEDGE